MWHHVGAVVVGVVGGCRCRCSSCGDIIGAVVQRVTEDVGAVVVGVAMSVPMSSWCDQLCRHRCSWCGQLDTVPL